MATFAGPGDVTGQRDSRVLVFSQRNIHQPAWHTPQYELEDLLLSLDDVDLLAPPAHGHEALSRGSRHLVNGAARRLGGRRRTPPWTAPSMQPTRVTADHDLFVIVIQAPYQLSYLRRLRGWRERCRRAVCLIGELWAASVDEHADYLDVLSHFDQVYLLFNRDALPAVARRTHAPPAFMPMGIDSKAFCPLPLMPERLLDCYSLGRTSPFVHRALTRLVEERGLTYLYDSLVGTTCKDYADHRALVANMMKRSAFFFSFTTNDFPGRRAMTEGEEALSTRYFEGVAGGAVLLGSSPRTPDFDEWFGWPDAVVSVPFDSTDVADVLDDLLAQPNRLATIRATNVRSSLLRHDWVYRWSDVLEGSQLGSTDAMAARRTKLEELAAASTPERFAPRPPSVRKLARDNDLQGRCR